MRYLSVSDADGRRRLVAEVDGQLRRVEGFADVGELLASGTSAATGEPLDRSRLTIRSPLARPGKIICIGLNYRDHCREQNIEPPRYPMLFAKFGNAVNDPGGSVLRPRATEKLDLECELGVVIGRSASRIGPAEALDHVFGYTVVNDITMRDLQAEDRQWLRAKGADGFAPIGPAVVSRDEMGDPQALAMRSSVNGETWQESSTAEMVFDVATLVAFVSTVIRLEPGDLIATGTPAGVGHYQRPPRYLADGDLLRCEIERIGAIETTVIDEVPRIADHGHAAGIEALEGARR
jgi:2-keto-4-pentenoate hydratase/2-oxohepta-3-ene-1,7-dioic acid hydratase in catechol pathway